MSTAHNRPPRKRVSQNGSKGGGKHSESRQSHCANQCRRSSNSLFRQDHVVCGSPPYGGRSQCRARVRRSSGTARRKLRRTPQKHAQTGAR
jgi:hypothetical protein